MVTSTFGLQREWPVMVLILNNLPIVVAGRALNDSCSSNVWCRSQRRVRVMLGYRMPSVVLTSLLPSNMRAMSMVFTFPSSAWNLKHRILLLTQEPDIHQELYQIMGGHLWWPTFQGKDYSLGQVMDKFLDNSKFLILKNDVEHINRPIIIEEIK